MSGDAYGWAAVDPADYDPLEWPEAVLDHFFTMRAWALVAALDRMGLVTFAVPSTGALLRLWQAGRRSDTQMLDRRPTHVRVPRWVNVLLKHPAGARGILEDDEVVRAAEAVARLTSGGVDSYIAIRKILTGEPAPHEGGWRPPA